MVFAVEHGLFRVGKNQKYSIVLWGFHPKKAKERCGHWREYRIGWIHAPFDFNNWIFFRSLGIGLFR
jgi:hypothetical protein